MYVGTCIISGICRYASRSSVNNAHHHCQCQGWFLRHQMWWVCNPNSVTVVVRGPSCLTETLVNKQVSWPHLHHNDFVTWRSSCNVFKRIEKKKIKRPMRLLFHKETIFDFFFCPFYESARLICTAYGWTSSRRPLSTETAWSIHMQMMHTYRIAGFIPNAGRSPD
jgi:hypothetical protein